MMNLKRSHVEHEEEEEGCSLVPGSKRPRIWINAMKEVMGAQCMQRHLSRIEPFLRRVVKEEVDNALCRHIPLLSRMPVNRIQGVVARNYQLLFQGKLPHTLFTASKIEAEDRRPVEIVIVDTISNEIIKSGPLSSLKIDILVINGDFGGDGQEEWTEEEFADSIVRERDGKRPLLTGELVVSLNNGIGFLGEATFTDNSSWIRSRKFRLGARVSQSRCPEGRVKEAISEAFLVKDHRGELYKKHHPPSLDDEIWRLEKISKDGAFCKRLTERGIKTVQDFLRYLKMDPEELRNLLGSGMSSRIWEAIVEHARECVQDGKFYSYREEQGNGLIFNSIFDVVEANFGESRVLIDHLNASQKTIVKELKQHACRNPSDIIECDEPLAESFSMDVAPIQNGSLLSPYSNIVFPVYQGFPHQTPAICDVPSQVNDVPIVQCPSVPFLPNGLDISDYFGPDDGLSIGYNYRECTPVASSASMLRDDDNGFIQVSTGGRFGCFSRPQNVGPPIHAGKWNKPVAKLVAALRWMSTGKCAPSTRARFAPLNRDMNEFRWA